MAKKGKKYALRDVRSALRQKKYSQARIFFAAAKIKKGQEQEAESLKKTIYSGQAYEYFKEHNFRKCLRYIESIEKDYPNLPDSVTLIKGLCHLFLAEHSLAEKLLGQVTEQPEFSSFRFYYLLNLVFQNENPTDYSLPAAEDLPKNKYGFLKITQAFRNGEFEEATALLKALETDSRTESENKDALLAVLKNQNVSITENRKVRPLYRAMLNLALTNNEIDYLSEFPKLTEQYSLSSEPKTTIDPKAIIEPIRRLCEDGIPLTSKEFALCQNAPEEILPQILYNHIAALFNQDRDLHLEEILKITNSNYSMLCRVPEFPFFYSEFIGELDRDLKLRGSVLRGVISTYVANFGDKLTTEKAAQVSWKLSNIAFQLPLDALDKSFNFIGKTHRQYPNMTALGWDCFVGYFKAIAPSINWSYLTLFTEPIDDFSQKEILKDFRELVKMIGLSSTMIPWEILEVIDDPDMVYKKMIEQVLNVFEALLTKQPPLKSEKFPLEILGVLGEMMMMESEQEGKVSPFLLNRFREVNQQYLDYFEEGIGSDFHKKHTEIVAETSLALEEFSVFFKDKKTYQQAINDGKDPVKALAIGARKLVREIEVSHFEEHTSEFAEDFLSYAHMAVVEYGEEEEKIVEVIRNFATQYARMTDGIECEHPTDFFYEMLEIILTATPRGLFNLQMAAAFFAAFNFVFDNDELEPRHIRLLTQFFETYNSSTAKNKAAKIDATLVKKLGKELEKIAL